MGLIGILLALALLMWLAYRGWSVLMVAPIAGLVAALIAGEPILAHFTQTFMPGAASFVAQWFPIFLLGGLFGKLMDDSGSSLRSPNSSRSAWEREGRSSPSCWRRRS